MFDVSTGTNGMGLLLKSRRFQVLLTDEFLSKVKNVLGDNAVSLGN